MKSLIAASILVIASVFFWKEASAYTTIGYKFNHLPITYSCGNAELALAIQAWADVSGLRDGGCTDVSPDIQLVVQEPWPYGLNILGVTATYGTTGSAGTISQSVIYVSEATKNHLGVLVHESGHALGLGHSLDKEASLFRYCCNPINADDIAAIVSLYGPQVPQQAIVWYKLTMPAIVRD